MCRGRGVIELYTPMNRMCLLLASCALAANGCGGVSPNAHVLDATDRAPRAGTVRVQIASERAVPIDRGTEMMELGEHHVCWTPCAVYVPPGPVALRAHHERFEVTAQRPMTQVHVSPPAEGFDILAYIVGFVGASTLFYSVIALLVNDFGSGDLGSTEIGYLVSAGAGLALYGLALGIGFGLSGPSVDAERVTAPSP